MNLQAVIAPMLTGKSTWTRHHPQWLDIDIPTAPLLRRTTPLPSWTQEQWDSWDDERAVAVEQYLSRHGNSFKGLLVHDKHIALRLNLPIIAAVIPTDEEFERRCTKHPDRCELAKLNRSGAIHDAEVLNLPTFTSFELMLRSIT
jgi:hypothetical protein